MKRIILVLILMTFLLSGCSQEVYNLFENNNVEEDALITKCTQSFNECKSIGEAKYGGTVKLLKKEKFENESNAEEFFEVWRGPTQIIFEHETAVINFDCPKGCNQLTYPSVLFATTIIGQKGQLPLVIFCDSKGEIHINSKEALDCG